MQARLEFLLSDKNPFISSDEKYSELTKSLLSKKIYSMRHSELEKFVSVEGRELMRRLFEEHLKTRGLGDVGKSIIGSDGVARNYRQISQRILITVFGKIKIERLGYSKPGKSSIFPLDSDLNLPADAYSHGIRRFIAYESSGSSFSEVVDSVARNTGITIHKRQVEGLSQKSAQDFDNYYEQICSLKNLNEVNDLPLLIMTTDGKGIVVRKDDLREQTKQRLAVARKKLNKRVSRGEKKNRKRMATVASVYNIAKFIRKPEEICAELSFDYKERKKKRPRPQAKRVWASLEKTQEEVIEEIFNEALRRDSKNAKKWACLVDGDKKQLGIIRRQIKKHAVSVVIILDIIHVIEYLWKAARVFHEEASQEAEKWVTNRLLEILRGKSGFVAGGMRRSATLIKIKKTDRAPIDVCANYLLKNSEYLHYNEYLKQGLPIATGVIEGACRHLIKDRMDITGARWSLKGAEAILKLRSLKASRDFDDYWEFHEQQELFRNHHSRYADSTILDKLSPKNRINTDDVGLYVEKYAKSVNGK